MQTKKLLYTAILLISCSLLFAACSSGVKEANSVSKAPAVTNAPAATNAPSPATDNKSVPITLANWDKVVEAAKKEGQVIVAGPPIETHRNTLMEFSKAYPGIELKLTSTNPAEFEPRLMTERSSGKFLWDIYITGTTASLYNKHIPNGVYAPIKPIIVQPDVLNDKNWVGGFQSGFLDNKGEYVYAFGADKSYPLLVNRDLVPASEFNSYEDLLNPKWKGKIAIYDPRQRGAINIHIAYAIDNLGVEKTKQIFTNQQPVIAGSPAQLGEWAVRGSYPIIIGLDNSIITKYLAQGQGTNLELIQSKLPPLVSNGWANVLMLNKAPNPNASAVFVNWLLSKEAQQDWTKRSSVNSRRLDIEPGNPKTFIKDGQDWINGIDRNSEKGVAKTEQAIQLGNEVLK